MNYIAISTQCVTDVECRVPQDHIFRVRGLSSLEAAESEALQVLKLYPVYRKRQEKMDGDGRQWGVWSYQLIDIRIFDQNGSLIKTLTGGGDWRPGGS